MLIIMFLMTFVIHPTKPVTLNDDLSKLYAVIEDDAEVIISTPSDAVEASYSEETTEACLME